ncbi:hypothetical protein BD309DRAFT_960833 [Dichomitus squalens]|uniref:Uncharacterized protein n=1 Tax=Dichomitus squalens TaxID=114155 RepID=A0A4Q9NTS1_9APHY|nr:hypothetical protein BD309DRAFT_960833 [Dichomitus squalens]TBU58225.1 hypothetical protein BD310DRAFT_927617 [Dichomitus squalens]
MKIFAFAAAFALGDVLSAVADSVDPNVPVHIFDDFADGLVVGAGYAPAPGSSLVMTYPEDGFSTFVLTAGTDEIGQIQLFGSLPRDAPLCMTATNATGTASSHPVTLEECDEDDELQHWFVGSASNGTLIRPFDNVIDCLAIPTTSPAVGDQVVLQPEPCQDQLIPRQLWHAIAA